MIDLRRLSGLEWGFVTILVFLRVGLIVLCARTIGFFLGDIAGYASIPILVGAEMAWLDWRSRKHVAALGADDKARRVAR